MRPLKGTLREHAISQRVENRTGLLTDGHCATTYRLRVDRLASLISRVRDHTSLKITLSATLRPQCWQNCRPSDMRRSVFNQHAHQEACALPSLGSGCNRQQIRRGPSACQDPSCHTRTARTLNEQRLAYVICTGYGSLWGMRTIDRLASSLCAKLSTLSIASHVQLPTIVELRRGIGRVALEASTYE